MVALTVSTRFPEWTNLELFQGNFVVDCGEKTSRSLERSVETHKNCVDSSVFLLGCFG
jgi:hypothetical protein